MSESSADWREVRLDTSGLRSKREVLAAIGEALAFPQWYGANLDALVDCLRDLTSPIQLVWSGSEDLQAVDPAAHAAIMDVLRSREAGEPPLRVVLD